MSAMMDQLHELPSSNTVYLVVSSFKKHYHYIILTPQIFTNENVVNQKRRFLTKWELKHEINVECKKVTQQHINDRFVTKELVFCKSASKFDNL